MVKTKQNALAKLPKGQRSKFIIGPISTWFRPDTSDMWSQPESVNIEVLEENGFNVSQDEMMDCDQLVVREDHASLSYFIYGSMGCFCYGEIHHHNHPLNSQGKDLGLQADCPNTISATVGRLVDVKEDNSKVSCVRFLKTSMYPLAMVLTEGGTVLIHDCLSGENLVLYKKMELVKKFLDLPAGQEETGEHCNKKAKFNVRQQLNSCLWPTAKHAFLGISLLREKTNLLIWLKLKDLTATYGNSTTVTKTDLIESHEKLNLDLPQYSSPINCMESTLLDSDTCLIAVAMDDGLICVLKLNFNQGQSSRVIKLARHNDQICSMSFHFDSNKRFPLGLLSSVSRDGLVLVWDVENEFYFADFQAKSEGPRSNLGINWFTLSFISSKEDKQVSLAVSNTENGLTILDVPINARSKIRLKDHKDKKRKPNFEQTIRHHALLFNVIFDPLKRTIFTSSLDGNHILWSLQRKTMPSKDTKNNETNLVEARPEYLLPSMPNGSRTHMLRHSPIREDLLGMALGKAGLRFYRVAKSSRHHRFDMNSSCSLIAHKVVKSSFSPTSLSWHPSHEYRLAIGTIEGKVLRVDLTPRKASLVECEHNPVLKSRFVDKRQPPIEPFIEASGDILEVEYEPLERKEIDGVPHNNGGAGGGQQLKTDGVYSMCWGPNPTCPDDVSRLAIYAVGSISHRLFIYHSKKETSDKLTNYLDEFLDQSLPEAIGEASEVAWKSSLDLMALGTTTGKIIIVSYDSQQQGDAADIEGGAIRDHLFKRIAVIQGPFGGAAIQCLAWHPTVDRKDEHYYYIATSAKESPTVFVFSISGSDMLVADVRQKFRIEDSSESKESISCATLFTPSLQPTTMTSTTSPSQSPSPSTTTTTTTATIMTTYLHKLEAHKKAVSDIAWNPHKLRDLATSSFDRQCYVWSLDDNLQPQQQQQHSTPSSVLTLSSDDSAAAAAARVSRASELQGRIKSKFSARDRLFTVEWSLVDSDLIFTSGHDSTVWAFRPSENRVDAP